MGGTPNPYLQGWLSRLPRVVDLGPRPGRRLTRPDLRRGARREPGLSDAYLAASEAVRGVTGPVGQALHTVLAPIGWAKQGVDWLTRQGASKLYGLELPETATAESVLRDVFFPGDASRGGLGLLPDAQTKAAALWMARKAGVDPEALREVERQPTLEEWIFGRLPRSSEATGVERARQLGRAAVGAGLEFGAGLALDPAMYLLPGALSGARGRRVAQRVLGPGGVPGVRQYAPSVAEALESAVKTPGAGRVARGAARALGVTPERFMAVADPLRTAAERGLHYGFGTQMGLGAVEGIDEAVRRGIESGRLTPESLEALVQGLGSGAMAAALVAGGRAKARAGREAERFRERVRPGQRREGGKWRPLPIDVVPDPLQRRAEGAASSLAESILRDGEQAAQAKLAELPSELAPHSRVIWEQARQEATDIRGGRVFLDRVQKEHPEGQEGVSQETGPDGDVRLVQRNAKGEVVGAAQLRFNAETGKQELATLAGGRAMGARESVRPLMEKLDEMGVERGTHVTALGAMARRRGAERFVPREVLEGRERPTTPEQVRRAEKEFIEAGLEDVLAIPQYASAGLLGRSWAPRGYVSPRERPLSGVEKETRRLSYDLREGKPEAVMVAAREMAPRVDQGSVLVPVPDSSGNTSANRAIADAIAKLRPEVEVLDYLGREGKVPSARLRRLKGEKPLSVREHRMRNTGDPRVFGDRKVYLVDNVVTQGTTFEAARRALGRHDAEGLAFARASDYPLYATKMEQVGEARRASELRTALRRAEAEGDVEGAELVRRELGPLEVREREAESVRTAAPAGEGQPPRAAVAADRSQMPAETEAQMPRGWEGSVVVTAPDGTPVRFQIWRGADGKQFAQVEPVETAGGVQDSYRTLLGSTMDAMKKEALRVFGKRDRGARPAYAVAERPAREMSVEERRAEIARLTEENREALATPLASEGGISPAEMGMMSSAAREKWQRNAQRRMDIEDRIRELSKTDEQLATESGAAAARRVSERETQILRNIEDLERVGVGRGGKIRPKYQREIDRLKRELEDISAGPRYAVEERAEPFFSQLRRVVESPKTQARQTGEQWLNFLRKRDVKADELKWTGLDDYLRERSGQRVTREEVQRFLDENRVEVEEVVRGEGRELGGPMTSHVAPDLIEVTPDIPRRPGEGPTGWELMVQRQPNGQWVFTPESQRRLVERDGVSRNSAGQWFNSPQGAASWAQINVYEKQIRDIRQPTKFGEYTLPGGEQYRELLLTLPAKGIYREPTSARRVAENQWQILDQEGRRIGSAYAATEAEALARYRETGGRVEMPGAHERAFIGGHFEEPNVLAHVRFNERTGPNGEKILFVEEIQSDWAQKGRREGFAEEVPTEGLSAKQWPDNPAVWEVTDAQGRFVTNVTRSDGAVDAASAVAEAVRRLREEPRRTRAGEVPRAPFVEKTEDWTNLAMKRVLKWAADEGYDKVAWTTGEQQAARYDLSKRIDAVDAYRQLNGDYLVEAWRGDDRVIERTVTPRELPDLVGKELADKIIGGKGEPTPGGGGGWTVRDRKTGEVLGEDFRGRFSAENWVKKELGRELEDVEFVAGRGQRFEGVDLKVGGEGMKGYYDKILPAVAGKIGKKFGAKVGETRVQTSEGGVGRFDDFREWMREKGYPESANEQWRTNGPRLEEFMETRGPQTERVHSIPVTPQMKETARREGFPLFAAEVERARRAEPLPMRDFLLKVYPDGTKIRETEGRYEVELPGGRGTVTWRLGADEIQIDTSAFEAAYGRKPREGERAVGVTWRMPQRAVVEIVEGAEPGIPLHEHWHVLKHLGALTEKQQRSLAKKYATEEAEADAFADWMQRRTPNTVFEKIWDSLVALYQQVTGAPEAVFRAAERGEPLRAGAGRPAAPPAPAVGRVPEVTPESLEEGVRQALERPPPAPRIATRPDVPVPERRQAELQRRTGVKVTPGAVAVGDPTEAPKYSVRTVQETKRAIEELNKKTGWFSDRELKKYFRDLDRVTESVVENRDRLDYTPAKHFSALKANADPQYKKSLDFSTLCVKRHKMQATIDEAQRRLERPLNSEEVMLARRALQERGVDTACGACYVESRRVNLKTVLDKARRVVPRRLHDLLLTEEGRSELAEKHPAEYAKFRKLFPGTQIKIPEARTEYRGEILDLPEGQVEAMNRASGLRWQSWSDFEVPHMLDAMQAIGDMSAKGLKGHAYTKQPDFVRVFGPSKLMINMSLIPKGTGLDSKGRLVFDEAQSFPWRQALRFRQRYDTAGTGVIGISDAHIRAALADPNIDNVIPYHASGLSKRFQQMVGMERWKDYSGENAFRDRTTGKVSEREVFWNEYEGDLARFDQLLEERNLMPPFARMRDWPGYEKLLTDRRIRGNDGELLAQEVVRPDFDMQAAQRLMDSYEVADVAPVGEVVEEIVQAAGARPAYAVQPMPEPEPPPMGRPKPPGEEPRVEQRVQNLEEAVTEQKKLGIPTDKLTLAREHRRNWDAIDPEVREIIRNWDDDTVLRMVERGGQLNDAWKMALDAVVRGRREGKELARMAYLERKGSAQEKEAWSRYAKALADYVTLERANVNDGTGTARALAARRRLMEAAQTPDRKFLKKALRELPGLTDRDAEQLVQMFENGDPRLADAIRAYSAGRWKQWQTLLRAFLITPSSEIPNLIGNSIVQGVELADAGVAAGIDYFTSKIRGRARERTLGEVGAELTGWREALPTAFLEFLKERFAGIYKRAWKGTSDRPISLERKLEYQVAPFKSKLPRLVVTSLDALAEGDRLFRAPIARAELKKRAYRLARRQLRNASRDEVARRGDELAFDILDHPDKYPDILQQIKSETSRRLFQGKPWKIVDHLRSMERDWPWMAAALPFVRTPANIARYAIHHSPMGMLTPEFARAVRALASGKDVEYQRGGKTYRMTPGEASDVVARRVVGTAIFGMAKLAADFGGLTGGGPADWDEKKALMETGWRPYSFVVPIGGQKFYIPYQRFDPVSQVMGVAADVSELGNVREANDLASKAIGSIAENFTDRTYLKGLIDFTEALNDPVRFAGNYAIGIATMHVPRQIGRLAVALDPVVRDVRPLDRSIAGLPERLKNSVLRNIPFLSESLPARVGPTGEEIRRPGEGVAGAVMRAVSPIQVSPERPGRELEALMAQIGYVPGEPRPYITVQGEQIMLDREDLELLQRADRAAAHELRRTMRLPGFDRLPDTVEEGGSRSKEAVIRDAYRRHRDRARQAMFRSLSFRRRARQQLRERAV